MCLKLGEMMKNKISTDEIEEIQKNWADYVILIGKLAEESKPYKDKAKQMLNELYNFDTEERQVLFKPTKVESHPFRPTRKSALSYFIGGDEDFPEDTGFALNRWKKINFQNQGFYTHGEMTTVMGHYYFTNSRGNMLKVEYSFGYVRDQKGAIKIFLHHSSMPFSSKK